MTDEIFVIPLALDLATVALGSLQGALFAASFKRIDLLGIAIISICCGIGGGLIRDVLLSVTPATFVTNWYIITCVTAGLIGMLLQRVLVKVDPIINVFDAISLGAFAAIGASKALHYDIPVVPAIFLGTITAVGGGIIRDLLLRLPVAAMHVGSFYGIAAVVGSTLTVTLASFHVNITTAGLTAVVVTAVLRLLAMRYGWSLPEQRALDRRRRRRAKEVQRTIEAIRTQTIQLPQMQGPLPEIHPEGPNGTQPRA